MDRITCLVGDIGGTNARFAVAEISSSQIRLHHPASVRCADFHGAEPAIADYLNRSGLDRPRSAVIAMAGPVTAGEAATTNGAWRLSETSLRDEGFELARLINDYAALAFAAGRLGDEDLATIGPHVSGEPGHTLAVVGAGTGFGVSGLARDGRTETPVVTEGGHAGFAPGDEVEVEVLEALLERYSRVSVERILSGPGLADLHWALGRIRGWPGEPLEAPAIVARGSVGDERCRETLERFCAIYGAVAGDIALAFGARGGVFIAGGIAPRILSVLQAGAFRARFEAKGRMSGYMAGIPTRAVTHPYAALVGAAAACPEPSQTPEVAVGPSRLTVSQPHATTLESPR